MISLGLLGKNIQHSRSKEMYQKILNQPVDYHLLDYDEEKEIPCLPILMEKISGLSITSPYKKIFLDSVNMDSEIADLNAINCVKKVGNEFYATNTDYLALNELIDKMIQQYNFSNTVFILGDGAMGKVLIKICEKKRIKYKVFSRKLSNICSIDDEFKDNTDPHLIINACAREYIFNHNLPNESVFWDLNYNLTAHEKLFQNKNITYIDGLSLLELQARHAVTFWNLIFS